MTPLEYRAFAEFRYRVRCFLNFSETSARAAKLEPQQHQLLLALKGLPPEMRPTIRMLSDRLQLRHNSTVELVQRSIERGLVERRPGTLDRREVLLRITPRGERLIARLSATHRTRMRSAAPELIEALENVLASGRAGAGEPGPARRKTNGGPGAAGHTPRSRVAARRSTAGRGGVRRSKPRHALQKEK
ncbi:MAG TPA: MarR family winged helix-turn-helix transcriptional regulator [Polyangiaceae bacterium]|nr:MarR family winged helix-turn-helix transcriptional regulator [Polyangiaceae bacterium]